MTGVESKISVIHGGYDPDAAQQSQPETRQSRNKEFTIGYMGKFDKAGFPWKAFLLALKRLISNDPQPKLKLNICGHVERETKDFIKEHRLEKYVICHGFLSHVEAVKRIEESDLLLVLLYETGYSKSIVPHKLYYYLAMGKTIMAIAEEDGEVADIINRTGTGEVVSLRKPDGILNSLAKYYKLWSQCGTLKNSPDFNEIKKYDYSTIAEQLAKVIKAD